MTDITHPEMQTDGASTAAVDRVVRLLCLLAGLAGMWFGYGFGLRISGVLIGVLAGLNTGALFMLTASSLADRLLQRRR
jgi:divalent metal cation (Fe/Co/Zn/Cd) transporter